MKVLKTFNRLLARAEDIVLVLLTLALIVLVGMQVFWRYVLNSPLQTTDELGRVCMGWLVFIGAAATTRLSQHIRLTMLTDKFSPAANLVLDVILRLLMIAFAVFLVKNGLYYAGQQLVTPMVTLPFPKTINSAAIPVFGVLTIYHCVYDLILICTKDPDTPHWKEVQV